MMTRNRPSHYKPWSDEARRQHQATMKAAWARRKRRLLMKTTQAGGTDGRSQ